MTATQKANLERMTAYGSDLLDLERKIMTEGEDKDSIKLSEDLRSRLDRWCLLFCISLLDHTLKGDLFESTVVAF